MIRNKYFQEWFCNPRTDIIAGTVVALALIPEAIAFSIIAGVDPKVGLYASFCIAVVIAFLGGRPGMISAATGAMAVLLVTLVKEHGLQYMLPVTVLTGILQILAGTFKLDGLMRFVSRSVVTGFVNALAIIILMAQLPEFKEQGILMYAMVALGPSSSSDLCKGEKLLRDAGYKQPPKPSQLTSASFDTVVSNPPFGCLCPSFSLQFSP